MNNVSSDRDPLAILERFRRDPKALEDNALFERLAAALGIKVTSNQAVGLWTCLRRPGWRKAANPVQYLKNGSRRAATQSWKRDERPRDLRVSDVAVTSFGTPDEDESPGESLDAQALLMDRGQMICDGHVQESRTPFPVDCSPNSIDPNLAPIKPRRRKDLPAMSWQGLFDDAEAVESLVDDSWILDYGHVDFRAVAKLPLQVAEDLLSLGTVLNHLLSTSERRAARRRLKPYLPKIAEVLMEPKPGKSIGRNF
jgi:signal transduction histidine kinase